MRIHNIIISQVKVHSFSQLGWSSSVVQSSQFFTTLLEQQCSAKDKVRTRHSWHTCLSNLIKNPLTSSLEPSGSPHTEVTLSLQLISSKPLLLAMPQVLSTAAIASAHLALACPCQHNAQRLYQEVSTSFSHSLTVAHLQFRFVCPLKDSYSLDN